MEHVGININSISSANYTDWNAIRHSKDIADAWISSYSSRYKILSVSWKYQTTSTSQENTSLSQEIDLMKVLLNRLQLDFQQLLVFDLIDDEDSEKGLAEWVWDHYGREELHMVVDERLQKDFDEEQVKCLIIAGMCGVVILIRI
ncbi:hypothetical protein PIB30_086258 [Stylosanthes scabra]|uniref:Legume lectin domain-containing protein n=1 Tax=Stylosanthes scabra TaxID=79078 RepID=A0ABU6SU69_9FABA|nr:hypothetical protein [Stylosanthes scabra]